MLKVSGLRLDLLGRGRAMDRHRVLSASKRLLPDGVVRPTKSVNSAVTSLHRLMVGGICHCMLLGSKQIVTGTIGWNKYIPRVGDNRSKLRSIKLAFESNGFYREPSRSLTEPLRSSLFSKHTFRSQTSAVWFGVQR